MKNPLNTLKTLSFGVALSIGFLPAIWSAAAFADNLSGRNMIDFRLPGDNA